MRWLRNWSWWRAFTFSRAIAQWDRLSYEELKRHDRATCPLCRWHRKFG